jgi:hypothetical protein
MKTFKTLFNKTLPFALLIVLVLVCINVDAQCAMCKAQAITSLQENDSDASGLNMAILYLFLTPYAILGIIGFAWYRNRKTQKA